jgi:outer membrane receptor protein involved in Fe transport
MKCSKLSSAIKLSLIASSTVVASYSPLATSAEEGANNLERIQVTGSRIKRAAMEGASPVTSISAEDIKVTGITRVEDVLNDMPSVFAGQTSGTANGATGTATVDLRNLGSERTLVLINGRRLPSGSPTNDGVGADLNQIPAALIKRVDVLTGGSSATYGSDAVAGVVNFVLKDDFEGFQLEYQRSLYQHDNDHGDMQRAVKEKNFSLPDGNVRDGHANDLSMILGVNSADDKGNITFYATVRDIKALTQDQRDYSACAMNINDKGTRLCGGSGTIPDGRITDFDTYDYKIDGSNFIPTDGTLFNYGSLNYFQRPDKRKTYGAVGHYEIDDNHTVYAEFNHMDDRTVAQIAPSGAFGVEINLECSNPLLSQQQFETLCGGNNLTRSDSITTNVLKRNVEGGPRQDDLRHTSTRFVFGLKGDVNDNWSYDAFMNFGSVAYVQTYENDLSKKRIGRALDVVADKDGNPVCRTNLNGVDPECVPWDIFSPSNITQEQLDYLIVPLHAQGDTKTTQISAYLSGDLTDAGWVLPNNTSGVGIVIGAEYRKEYISLNPDKNFQSGDGAGQGGTIKPVEGQFNVKEIFTELNIPVIEDGVVDNLNLELAYRYSDYSTGKSTDTYKFAVDMRINDSVGVRSSYQRAVRAGNIQELFRPARTGLFNWADPCGGTNPTLTFEQCARTGVTATQYGSNALINPAGQYNNISGGNTNLSPEKSDTYSIGLLFSPEFIPNLDIAIDYFNIKVNDAISSIPEANIHNKCAVDNDAESCALISRGSNGNLWLDGSSITSMDLNLGSIETSGIDIDIVYSHDIGELGSMTYSAIGTFLSKYEEIDVPGEPGDDCVGYWDRAICEVPVPKIRTNLSTTWTTPWDAKLTAKLRYYGSVDEYMLDDGGDVVNGPTTLSAQYNLDIAGTWNYSDSLILRAGVNNLLDRDPPLVPNGPSGEANGNTYPGQYDALGRYLFAGFTYTF